MVSNDCILRLCINTGMVGLSPMVLRATVVVSMASTKMDMVECSWLDWKYNKSIILSPVLRLECAKHAHESFAYNFDFDSGKGRVSQEQSASRWLERCPGESQRCGVGRASYATTQANH